MKQKKALITGITGQDGSYLAEFLLKKGYGVHGLVRRSSSFNRQRIEHLYSPFRGESSNFHLHYGDMTDASSLLGVIAEIKPDEIYNLAAQSHVHVSYETPEYTTNADALGAIRILEAVRKLGLEKTTRYYQASTSELFGIFPGQAQNELTTFRPKSPYGAAKLCAYWLTVIYREAYGIFACNGLLFNHESPRRGESFVTRKITYSFAQMTVGKLDHLMVGNLNAKRDWGYAPEYVEAMWQMLQLKKPVDLVIATGETHSVREFIEEAGKHCGFHVVWKGKGMKEVGIDKKTGRVLVRTNSRYVRPTEIDLLKGDASKAKRVLGWKPQVKFKELVRIMMKADLELARKKARS